MISSCKVFRQTLDPAWNAHRLNFAAQNEVQIRPEAKIRQPHVDVLVSKIEAGALQHRPLGLKR